MKKLWKGIITALLVLPFITTIFGATTVHAEPTDPTDVNIIVNKRVWDTTDAEKPTEDNQTPNTGVEMSDFGGTPLNGVGFTIYDVTTEYHEAIASQTGTKEEAQKAAITAILDAESTLAKDGNKVDTEKITTGDAGQATFTVPLKSGGKDAVYLIVETSTPNSPTIVEKAQSIVLAMPIYTATDSTGTLNRNIYVYPKNVKAENTKEFTNSATFANVTIDDTEYKSVNIGDTLSYKLNINVPVNFDINTNEEGLTTYVIKDTPAAGLALAGLDSVSVGTLTKDTDYTIEATGGGFAITLKKTDATEDLRGQLLTITYNMTLTFTVGIDTGLNNNASVELNGNPTTEITPPIGVSTGGMNFVKKDAHTGKGLAGATFVVKNAGGKFASFTGTGPYVFAGWKDAEADATVITSGTDGKFTIQGLKAGDYSLVEKTAPTGYVLNTEPVAFTITANSYTDTEQVKSVPNTPKGLLPSTGGNGIYAFLLVGAALMIGSYAWFRKSKTQAEV